MTNLHPGFIVVLAAVFYVCSFVTGWLISKRRTHNRLTRQLCADP